MTRGRYRPLRWLSGSAPPPSTARTKYLASAPTATPTTTKSSRKTSMSGPMSPSPSVYTTLWPVCISSAAPDPPRNTHNCLACHGFASRDDALTAYSAMAGSFSSALLKTPWSSVARRRLSPTRAPRQTRTSFLSPPMPPPFGFEPSPSRCSSHLLCCHAWVAGRRRRKRRRLRRRTRRMHGRSRCLLGRVIFLNPDGALGPQRSRSSQRNRLAPICARVDSIPCICAALAHSVLP